MLSKIKKFIVTRANERNDEEEYRINMERKMQAGLHDFADKLIRAAELKRQEQEEQEITIIDNIANNGESTCIVCMVNEPKMVFVPCGHNISCCGCSSKINECPLCRKDIEKSIQVFKS
jgi:hypothetical protein